MSNNVNRPVTGCTHHTTAAADVIQWSNWEIRKGRTQWLSLLGFVLGGGIVAFLLVVLRNYWERPLDTDGAILWQLVSMLVLGGMMLGVIVGVLFSVVQLVRQQTLIVTSEQVSFYEIGRWRTYKRQYDKQEVLGVYFGKSQTENGRVAELQLFLICEARRRDTGQLWRGTRSTRIPLASWMHTADQYTLFLLLKEIFEQRQWQIVVQEGQSED